MVSWHINHMAAFADTGAEFFEPHRYGLAANTICDATAIHQ
jgi:hypothetical protein